MVPNEGYVFDLSAETLPGMKRFSAGRVLGILATMPGRRTLRWIFCLGLAFLCSLPMARAQTDVIQSPPAATSPSAADTVKLIDRLVEQNGQLEKQNKELLEQIQYLRGVLAQQSGGNSQAVPQKADAKTESTSKENVSGDVQEGAVSAADTLRTEEPYKWGRYNPNLGFKVADTDHGDLSISLYTYARYLNQLGLDPHYTDASGNVKNVQQRQDFQFQKVQIKFLGWILDPKASLLSLRLELKPLARIARAGRACRQSQLHVQGLVQYWCRHTIASGHAQRRRQLSLLARCRQSPDGG